MGQVCYILEWALSYLQQEYFPSSQHLLLTVLGEGVFGWRSLTFLRKELETNLVS